MWEKTGAAMAPLICSAKYECVVCSRNVESPETIQWQSVVEAQTKGEIAHVARHAESDTRSFLDFVPMRGNPLQHYVMSVSEEVQK